MKLRHLLTATCGGIALAALGATSASAAASCESLTGFKGENVTITVAKTVEAMGDIAANLAQTKLAGPLCRVAGFISPTKDSHIRFEVWLPAESLWNKKFQAVGNGGFQGALNYRAMLPGIGRGYATMTTDLGHANAPGSTEDAAWALGHPDKVVDYAYRAEHVTTLAAKQIVAAFYSAPPAHSYYTGCSAGGIRGLHELLRFSSDFDGYLIGAATPDHLGQEMAAMWNTLAASLADPANALQAPEINLVHNAVLKQCAGKDGGAASDRFLTNPAACRFEPKSLLCKPGQDTSTCLSAAQVAIFDKVYKGPTNPRTGQAILSGLTRGSELGWDKYFVGKKNPAPADRPWATFMSMIVHGDPEYLTKQKYQGFDFDKDYDAVKKTMIGGETLASSWTATSRNLEPLKTSGGKVIQYHGWDDPNIPALESIRLYESVVADQAARHKLSPQQAQATTQDFYRLFLAPGTGHCTTGDGPSSFGQNGQGALKADPEYDTLIALERWVEQGVAPDKFVGSRVDAKTSAVDMTRPICAYPKAARWNGKGDPNDAASFACAAPARTQAAR